MTLGSAGSWPRLRELVDARVLSWRRDGLGCGSGAVRLLVLALWSVGV